MEINIDPSHIQKHVSNKNDIKSTYIMCTGSQESFPMHYVLRGKFFKAYFNILMLQRIKWNQDKPFECTKAGFLLKMIYLYVLLIYIELMIHLQGHIKGFWYIKIWKDKLLKVYFNEFM